MLFFFPFFLLWGFFSFPMGFFPIVSPRRPPPRQSPQNLARICSRTRYFRFRVLTLDFGSPFEALMQRIIPIFFEIFWWIFPGVVWATRREVWILCFIANDGVNGRCVASCVFFFCCSFFFFVSLAVQSFFFFIFFTVSYHPWFSFSPGSTHYWTSSSSHVAV